MLQTTSRSLRLCSETESHFTALRNIFWMTPNTQLPDPQTPSKPHARRSHSICGGCCAPWPRRRESRSSLQVQRDGEEHIAAGATSGMSNNNSTSNTNMAGVVSPHGGSIGSKGSKSGSCDEDLPNSMDVQIWSSSFDSLLRSQKGRRVLRDYLKTEYSEENILFWLACEDLKKETDESLIEQKARMIYEDFISVLSLREVSLDSRVREILNRSMGEPTSSTFDEAQMQIYMLMQRDSYPRFLLSPYFRTLKEQVEERESSSKPPTQ